MSTAAFPGSIRYFTDKRDSFDEVRATQINIPQAEITAIELTLGTGVAGPYPTVAQRLSSLESITLAGIAGVSSLNSLVGTVLLSPGVNLSITTAGSTITIAIPTFPWNSLTGVPTTFSPTANSGYYIWNQTAVYQTAAFSIAGNSNIQGCLSIFQSGIDHLLTLSGTAGQVFITPSAITYPQAIYGSKVLQIPSLSPIGGDTLPLANGTIWYNSDTLHFYRRENGVIIQFGNTVPTVRVKVLVAGTGITQYSLDSKAASVFHTRLYKDGLRLVPIVEYNILANGTTIQLVGDPDSYPITGDILWVDYDEDPTL